MLAHVHIRRQGDEERIQESYNNLIQLSDEELKEKCMYYSKQPFFGVHAQALFFHCPFQSSEGAPLGLPAKNRSRWLNGI
jgi:lipopolysaccharide biosynthesis regulator YciM